LAQIEEEKVKRKPNKLVIIIVIMSFVILAGAVTMVFVVTDITISDVISKFQKHEEYVMPLDSFVVNLDTEGKGSTYLKTQMSLLYTDEDYGKILENKTSQIRDLIIKDLMEYRPDDLLINGGLAIAKLKIRTSINAALGEDMVKEIYFTEFLIQ
jgi:flagellar FliL protein